MWVRLDDDFPANPKIIGLSHEAFRVYIIGLCYSAHYLTDGYIPATHVAGYRRAIRDLISAGLWTATDHGYHIHDWSDYNPSAERVKQRRKAEAERQASHRESRRDNARDVRT